MMNAEIDAANAKFWDELCGTTFARKLGITGRSPESLRRFDDAYLDMYPYLLKRVPVHAFGGLRVLEVGLGYGTLGQKIAEAGADYTGVDIARGPVDMMNHRLRLARLGGRAQQASILDYPLKADSVDCVVSIGCFHHTGDMQGCIDGAWRILKPGGRAFLMVYNRNSYFRWVRWLGANLRGGRSSEGERRAYDVDSEGQGAPETVFVSRGELRRMMHRFRHVSLQLEDCTHLGARGITIIPRKLLLPVLGRLSGLHIYASAVK
jgi:SAM-dependent methyltransferase